MSDITFQQFRDAAGLTNTLAESFFPAVSAAFKKYEINTPLRQAHFIAQCGHESAGFTVLSENLNYAESALLVVFRGRISAEEAKAYGRNTAHPANQQMIANIVYANRNGNGPVASGDGFKFRGRGLIQITGRKNYRAVGYESSPAMLASVPGAVDSAGMFWHNNGLNALADKDDIKAVTVKVNGGTNGIADRSSRLVTAKKYLGVI